MKEEWRTVVIDGKEDPWYSVSNLGNVRSHLQNISLEVPIGDLIEVLIQIYVKI